jgi:hypothetical protein
MKVCHQRKGQAAHGCPSAMAVQAVHRDDNHLGIEAFEPLELTLIQAQLIAARGAPVKRIEDQRDILPLKSGCLL